MEKKHIALVESVPFLMGITFLGGFLDTYTYVTRGGVFANNHTGNMAKLGIMLARAEWEGALNCLIPILACVFGAAASEFVKHRASAQKDWRQTALFVEAIALCAVVLVPSGVGDIFVNTALSFITGFQLCLFRNSQWGAHNTTICTGNLRSVGQFLYAALSDRTGDSCGRLIKYSCVVFSFVIGAAAGVPVCVWLGSMACLFGALIASVLLIMMRISANES